MINEFITNEIVIVCFLSLVISQILKTLIFVLKGAKFNIRRLLIGDGGMPSSHTAVVSGLTTSVLLLDGMTTLFFVSLVFTFVIIRDAIGVRMESGKHAVLLNKLVKIVYKGKNKSKLDELLGHSPLQVLVGIVIGIIAAVLII